MRKAGRGIATVALLLLGTTPSQASSPSPAPASKITEEAKVRCTAAYEEAQELRRQERLMAAKSELSICVQTCPAILLTDCVRWQSEVDALMPTVLLRATDDRGRPIPARVLLDGTLLLDRWTEAPVAVDAGDHTFRFETPTGLSQEVRVSLHSGERGRDVHAALFATAPAPVRLTAGSPPSRPVPRAAWVVGGVGAFVLTAGGALALVGHVQESHLSHSCAPHCTPAEVSTVVDLYDVAWVSAGVGAALLLTSLLVWRPWSSSVESRAQAASSSILVAPSLGGGLVKFSFQ